MPYWATEWIASWRLPWSCVLNKDWQFHCKTSLIEQDFEEIGVTHMHVNQEGTYSKKRLCWGDANPPMALHCLLCSLIYCNGIEGHECNQRNRTCPATEAVIPLFLVPFSCSCEGIVGCWQLVCFSCSVMTSTSAIRPRVRRRGHHRRSIRR